MQIFEDRYDAAYKLVPYLTHYKNNPDAIVLAIPRGGLKLGFVLARSLHLPLDVVLTKKIGYPDNPEYAIGAVSLDSVNIDPEFAGQAGLQEYIAQQTIQIRKLLHERSIQYYGDKPAHDMSNKIVIVVDDGVATGNTLFATLGLIKKHNPQKIVVALPVASRQASEQLRKQVDEFICLEIPIAFMSVGQVYKRFDQVSDQEAIRLLHEAHNE